MICEYKYNRHKALFLKSTKLKNTRKEKMKILTFGKITLTAITLTAILSGCGGVDKEKLAELTSDKNFAQIKKDYIIADLNRNDEKLEIYGYWLQKNGPKVNPTFDFEIFRIKTDRDVQKELENFEKEKKHIQKAFEKEMQSIKNGNKLDYNAIKSIKSRLSMLYFMPHNINYVQEYIKFLSNIEDQLLEADENR